MKYLSIAIVLLAACVHPQSTGNPQPSSAMNVLTDAERSAGWRLLFDGTSTNGWRGYKTNDVPPGWKAVDGALTRVSESADIMTEDSFRNFELTLEWKIAPGGNSGIKYNVSEELSVTLDPTHAAKAFEYQMLDDDRHPDGKLPTHRAGALYDLVAPNAAKVLRPVGEWNASRIILVGNHGEHWLNGAKIVSYDLGTPAMDSALTASKYHGWPWFADRRSGHIVIQDHGDEIWIRNIRIRSLTDSN